MLPAYYLLMTTVLSYHFQKSHQLQAIPTIPECFSNVNIWKIYSKHFAFANTVTVKILTIVNHKENDMKDTTTIIINNIVSLTPVKTVEVQKCDIEGKVYIERKTVPPEIGRNKVKYNLPSSNKYKILRSSSDPEEAYLIIAWNEEVIYQFLEEKPSFIFPKSRALYVVLLVFQQTDSDMVFEEIVFMLKIMWEKYNIFNIIVQAPCTRNSDDIYIYKPFKTAEGLVQINKIEEILANEYLIVNQLRDMNGAFLQVSLFEREPTSMSVIPKGIVHYAIYKCVKNDTGYYGFDANVLAGMSNYLNFKIEAIHDPHSDYGKTLKSGYVTGSLGQVVRREVQLSANGRFVSDYGTPGIEFTKAFSCEQICFIVPKSQRKPHWMSIFYCFKMSVWLLMMAVILIAISVWYLYKRSMSGKQDISKICLEILSICFSIPGNISTNGAGSLFLGTLMMFNIVINGIFQGNLINSFSMSVYFPDINTLQELADSDLKISTSLNMFDDYTSEVFKELEQKVDHFKSDDNMSAMDRSAYLRTWAATERKSDARVMLETKYTNEAEEPLLHIVDECPHFAFLAYIVPQGSPFLPKFNAIIQTFLEGGFIEKWNTDIVEAIIVQKRLAMTNNQNIPRKLTAKDFQASFFVLVAGYAISAIIFFFETYLQKCRTSTFLKKVQFSVNMK